MKKAVWIPLACIGGIIATIITAFYAWLCVWGYNIYLTRNYFPNKQPGTTWVTEDGKVAFCANEYDGYGTIQTEDGPVEIAVTLHYTVPVHFYYKEDYQQLDEGKQLVGPRFAWGWGDVKNDHKFVVEITSADEYFEAGEKLVFYKVEE